MVSNERLDHVHNLLLPGVSVFESHGGEFTLTALITRWQKGFESDASKP
jgi:hypothetical protein